MTGSFTWINLLALLFTLIPKSGTETNEKSVFGKRSFSGEIIYEVIYESKSPFISVSDLERAYGTKAVLYIQNDNYKMTFNGDYTRSMLYIGKENKQLVTFSERDSTMWRDCDRYDSRMLGVYYSPKEAVVLGRSCDELMIETDWGVTRYYYDRHLYLRPRGFRHHGFNYFNLYLRYAKAPYLKCVYDGPNFKRTMIAVDVQEKPLSSDIFRPISPVAMGKVNKGG